MSGKGTYCLNPWHDTPVKARQGRCSDCGTATSSGPSPEVWRFGLHALHCREDRCGPAGERCSCPCHTGEPMPELGAATPSPDPVFTGMLKAFQCIEIVAGMVADLDKHAGSSIEQLTAAVRVLSDRVTMLERESKPGGGPVDC